MSNYTMSRFANKYEMMLPTTTTKCDATKIIINEITGDIRDAVHAKLNDINIFMTHKVLVNQFCLGFSRHTFK